MNLDCTMFPASEAGLFISKLLNLFCSVSPTQISQSLNFIQLESNFEIHLGSFTL